MLLDYIFFRYMDFTHAMMESVQKDGLIRTLPQRTRSALRKFSKFSAGSVA